MWTIQLLHFELLYGDCKSISILFRYIKQYFYHNWNTWKCPLLMICNSIMVRYCINVNIQKYIAYSNYKNHFPKNKDFQSFVSHLLMHDAIKIHLMQCQPILTKWLISSATDCCIHLFVQKKLRSKLCYKLHNLKVFFAFGDHWFKTNWL